MTTEKKTPTGLRLPVALKERLDKEADARATSSTHLVCKALEFYLDNLPSLDPRDSR